MGAVSTRRATANDAEFAFQVRKAAFQPVLELIAGWDEENERRQHDRRFSEYEFTIVQYDGLDVGVAVLDRDAPAVKLHQLFILPTHQGQGIGTAFMTRLLESARSDGFSVHLRVLAVNERAIAFYERLGFRRTASVERYTTMENRP